MILSVCICACNHVWNTVIIDDLIPMLPKNQWTVENRGKYLYKRTFVFLYVNLRIPYMHVNTYRH
jgi:hypothetical protein